MHPILARPGAAARLHRDLAAAGRCCSRRCWRCRACSAWTARRSRSRCRSRSAYGFLCLSAWYAIARTRRSSAPDRSRVIATACAARVRVERVVAARSRAAGSVSLALVRAHGPKHRGRRSGAAAPTFFGFGFLLYLLAMAMSYLAARVRSRRATPSGGGSSCRSWRARRNCARCARRSIRTFSSTACSRSAR